MQDKIYLQANSRGEESKLGKQTEYDNKKTQANLEA